MKQLSTNELHRVSGGQGPQKHDVSLECYVTTEVVVHLSMLDKVNDYQAFKIINSFCTYEELDSLLAQISE